MNPSSNRILLLVGLVVSAGLLVGSSSTEAAFPGANGKIAFVSGVGEDFGIHVMKADGSGQSPRLTNGVQPAWSPDGSEIAFATRSTR